MATREMKLYGDKIYGVKVSDYGLEHGYLRFLGGIHHFGTAWSHVLTDIKLVKVED